MFLPAAPIETRASAILVTAGIFILLSLMTVILLGHLLTFHIYLSRYYVPVICIPFHFRLAASTQSAFAVCSPVSQMYTLCARLPLKK